MGTLADRRDVLFEDNPPIEEVMDREAARDSLKRHAKYPNVTTEDMERMRDRYGNRPWVLGASGGNERGEG